MNRLHVNSQLTAMVGDDQDPDAAAAGFKGFGKTGPEIGLVDDGEGLLDVAGFGHCDDRAILQIQNAVLLEDRTKHSLDNNTRAWVRDERGLLMQLLGEEVNTQVAVLAGCRRGSDADNLARTALEDQEVAETDVVAGNGDGVGGVGFIDGSGGADRSWA